MTKLAPFLDTVTSPALRAIATHWDEVRGRALMPSWEQLRPARIAPYLSLIWAFKYERDSDTFFGRLAGSHITRGFEKNFRGLPLTEAYMPAVAEKSQKMMNRIVSEPAIYRSTGELFKHAGRTIEGERIILPLGKELADGVLGASAYHYPGLNVADGPIELLPGTGKWLSLAQS